MYRFRYLDPQDQERWPGWYEVDMGAMHDMDSGVVMDWEQATGYLALDDAPDSPRNIGAAAQRREMKALLAVHWLAIRLAGDTTRWEDFRPKVLKVEHDLAAAGADGQVDDPNPRGPATNRAARRAKSASAAGNSPRARKAAQPRSGS